MKKHLLAALSFLFMITAHSQWINQNANFINDTLGFYEMSLPDQNTAWAVCYDGKGGLLSGRPVLDFTRTTNGGNLWTPGKMGNDNTLRFSNISAIDGDEAWVAMHKIGAVPNNLFLSFGKGGGIFHTKNAGLNWEQSNPGELFDNNSVPRFVHFKDKNHGIAVGDPNGGYFEIYITNNKGKKWKRVKQENIPAALANEVGWISGHAVIGNTIWFGTSAGRMYKSEDFGKSWTVHVVDPSQLAYVNEIAFLDDGLTGVAHLRRGNFVFVYSTTDGGLTWTNYFQPANWKNSRMTAVPGTNAFVSTSVHGLQQFRGSAVSYDAGKTWTEIENTANKAVCRFYDANTGYAGGFFVTGPPLRGGIFKSQIVFQTPLVQSSNEVVSRGNAVNEKLISEASVNVFPSPARNVINISLNDEMIDAPAMISIVSMDGRQIQSTRSMGTKTVQLDVSKLTKGIYIVQIGYSNQVIRKTISIVR